MDRRSPQFCLAFACSLTLLALSGCADNRSAVPPELTDKVQVVGVPGVRSYVTSVDPLMAKSIMDSVRDEDRALFPVAADGSRSYAALAISGGADNGAYGAGLLKGWSESGKRPVFKAVTGVSTGALIASYAFLGSEYDSELEQIFTNISTKDIVERKKIITGLLGNSLASSAPLKSLIDKHTTDRILKDIAREHNRGRRLFVGTANLDAQKLAIWDMGAIAVKASDGSDEAKELFKKVLLASASIPVTFPPVFFDVESGGNTYKEMHVDGGTLTQVFFTYGLVNSIKGASGELGLEHGKIKADLYIIRNGRTASQPGRVINHVAAIAEKAIDTMTGAQAIGDIYRLYAFAKERGSSFHLASIPADFESHKREFFDKEDMRRLYDRGYRDALGQVAWQDSPPGWESATGKKE